MTSHRDVRYVVESPAGAAALAIDSGIAVGFLPPDDPVWIIIDGICPTCHAQLSVRHPVRVWQIDGSTLDLNSRKVRRTQNVPITCECELEHPDRPAENNGCGRSFSLEIVYEA